MSVLKRILKSLVALIVLFIAFIAPSHADELSKLTETDDLVIEGQKEFQQRCAVCHGEEGKGQGNSTD